MKNCIFLQQKMWRDHNASTFNTFKNITTNKIKNWNIAMNQSIGVLGSDPTIAWKVKLDGPPHCLEAWSVTVGSLQQHEWVQCVIGCNVNNCDTKIYNVYNQKSKHWNSKWSHYQVFSTCACMNNFTFLEEKFEMWCSQNKCFYSKKKNMFDWCVWFAELLCEPTLQGHFREMWEETMFHWLLKKMSPVIPKH